MTAPHAVLKKFPPLGKPKSPRLAALIGALTGGIWRTQSSNRRRAALAVAVGSAG
jgi:hypothetical protein